ncbi:MAG: TRAP transporter large permease subunit, partial [Comamonadaceae bacterium]|nr:TRAP transporter large permease subunit [Comamonadaceae bacterium]
LLIAAAVRDPRRRRVDRRWRCSGVAWIGDGAVHRRARPATRWRSRSGARLSSWTLTALPLFIWMGEILFRTRLSEDMFRGLAPWLQRLPGRLLHTNIIGCTIFAAVSGSSAATCATIGKMTLPELQARGYPEDMIDRHAGRRRHAGPADPAVDHHDRLRRRGRGLDRASCSSPACCPGCCWPGCSWATSIVCGRCAIRDAIPPAGRADDASRRSCARRAT